MALIVIEYPKNDKNSRIFPMIKTQVFINFGAVTADDRSGMLSNELSSLLVQVITSWQVLAITGALVVYMYLVAYVARTYHRPRMATRLKPKKVKKEKSAAPTVANSDDELLSE
jgi:hypothetical protein